MQATMTTQPVEVEVASPPPAKLFRLAHAGPARSNAGEKMGCSTATAAAALRVWEGRERAALAVVVVVRGRKCRGVVRRAAAAAIRGHRRGREREQRPSGASPKSLRQGVT